MLVSTIIEIDGIEYALHYSDSNRYIVRDGQQWEEAVDPLNSGREYTEGDPIPKEEGNAEQILDILLGGADD